MPISKPVPITPTWTSNNRFRAQALLGNPGHHRILASAGIKTLGPEAVQWIVNRADSRWRRRQWAAKADGGQINFKISTLKEN